MLSLPLLTAFGFATARASSADCYPRLLLSAFLAINAICQGYQRNSSCCLPLSALLAVTDAICLGYECYPSLCLPLSALLALSTIRLSYECHPSHRLPSRPILPSKLSNLLAIFPLLHSDIRAVPTADSCSWIFSPLFPLLLWNSSRIFRRFSPSPTDFCFSCRQRHPSGLSTQFLLLPTAFGSSRRYQSHLSGLSSPTPTSVQGYQRQPQFRAINANLSSGLLTPTSVQGYQRQPQFRAINANLSSGLSTPTSVQGYQRQHQFRAINANLSSGL
jgi:hypothetical protein